MVYRVATVFRVSTVAKVGRKRGLREKGGLDGRIYLRGGLGVGHEFGVEGVREVAEDGGEGVGHGDYFASEKSI